VEIEEISHKFSAKEGINENSHKLSELARTSVIMTRDIC